MGINKYSVILTNGTRNDYYTINALNKTEAIILAQAEAIKEGKGYMLVSISEID